MSSPVPGLHHVTAICGDPARNVAFYTGLLGLRMVKRTVDFDDPSTWHLYYGDGVGSPGSLVTFFAWPGGSAGRPGAGAVHLVQLAIPSASLGWWVERLLRQQVPFEGPDRAAGETRLLFRDPDGLPLALVGVGDPGPGWTGGAAPAEHAVRRLHGVTLWVEDPAPTAAVLRDVLGWADEGSRAGGVRFRATPARGVVDVRGTPGFWRAQSGVGTVHHVAFRVADDATEARVRAAAVGAGLPATTVRDREYFRSVYFREPEGVLLEVATDGPGFALDEPLAHLGEALCLPPWLESRRAGIAAGLPPLPEPAPGAMEPR